MNNVLITFQETKSSVRVEPEIYTRLEIRHLPLPRGFTARFAGARRSQPQRPQKQKRRGDEEENDDHLAYGIWPFFAKARGGCAFSST